MLINLAILHIVALIIKGGIAGPIRHNVQDGQLQIYKLLNDYHRNKQDRLTNGTDKRGKYSWSVAYGKRDRWIAYGKRNSNQDEREMSPFIGSSGSQDGPMYYNIDDKRQQAWVTRWGKRATTAAAQPTTKTVKVYDEDQSYEGYFTKNPLFKRQQWTKFAWGKRSF